MASPSDSVYCPRIIATLVNVSLHPVNSTAKLSPLSTFIISIHGLFSSIGIVENLLILGIVGFHVHRSVISIWILNLAASDLLATASLPFFTIYLAHGNTWTLGTTFCRLHSSVFFLNMFVSGFLLAAISLDRCLVVLKPVWAQNYRNIGLVGKVCGVLWALAIIFTIPFYIFRDTYTDRNGRIKCYYNYARMPPAGPCDLESLCKTREEALALTKFFVAFLIPLVLIIFSYVTVNTSLARRSCRRPYRFVRLVVAVVVSFVICWAPYHILSVMEVLMPKSHSSQQFIARALPTAATIGFLNSVLNPILYVFSCPDLCRKIRHSLGAVMESVLAEDLAELARRRSTARSSLGAVEVALKHRNSVTMFRTEGEPETSEGLSTSNETREYVQ